jgi:SUKH-3 immunity protein of toxin-antitoxin system
VNDPVLDERGRPGRWHLVDEPPPVRLPPFVGPAEAGGFRIARVFDPAGDDGRPRVEAARGRVTDVDERRRLLGFLEGGTVVADAGVRATDVLEPRRVAAVPVVARTDGTWIWDDAVAYYLRWHHVPPEPDLLAHIRDRGYHAASVSGGVREAARAAVAEASDGYARRLRQWQVATGQLADPARFPFAVQERLLGIGWAPGRDVSDVVDRWLGEALPRLREYEFTAHGLREVEPFAAALRVLYEFGGLRSADAGPGVTSARIPFVVFPGERGEERSLWPGAPAVVELAARLGQPVFQLGTIENGAALLVIAGDGSVHLAGTVERFVGASFDEAIVALLDGDLPDPATDPYEIDPFA